MTYLATYEQFRQPQVGDTVAVKKKAYSESHSHDEKEENLDSAIVTETDEEEAKVINGKGQHYQTDTANIHREDGQEFGKTV